MADKKPCSYYAKGTCRNGSKCQFAHVREGQGSLNNSRDGQSPQKRTPTKPSNNQSTFTSGAGGGSWASPMVPKPVTLESKDTLLQTINQQTVISFDRRTRGVLLLSDVIESAFNPPSPFLWSAPRSEQQAQAKYHNKAHSNDGARYSSLWNTLQALPKQDNMADLPEHLSKIVISIGSWKQNYHLHAKLYIKEEGIEWYTNLIHASRGYVVAPEVPEEIKENQKEELLAPMFATPADGPTQKCPSFDTWFAEQKVSKEWGVELKLIPFKNAAEITFTENMKVPEVLTVVFDWIHSQATPKKSDHFFSGCFVFDTLEPKKFQVILDERFYFHLLCPVSKRQGGELGLLENNLSVKQKGATKL